MKYFEDYVQDKYGNRQSSVSLTVNVNGSAATVYSSKTGAAQSNPITTDSDGNFSFWYNKPGTYTFLDSNSNVLLTKTLEVTTNVVEFGCAGNGTTDDTTAFQNAVNEGGVVVVPSGDYLLSPGITLPDGVTIVSDAVGNASGSDYSNFPAPRLLFTGTGAAGFVSADESTLLNEGAIAGLTIQTTDDAQIDYLFDLRGPLSWTFKDLRIENKWTGGGGFRSRAILTDPTTWLNRMYNVEIRVNDASTKYALDVDWSDSAAIGCVFTGGLGSIYRGPGNMEFIGDQFDRATSSGAGLCLSKELASNGQINVAACSFDANVGPGLKFTAQSSPSGTVYSPTITGCGFRNPSATDDIVFDSTSISSVMSGPVITGCAFSQSGVVPWSLDESKWLVAFGLNYYANTSWVSTIFGDTRAQTTVIGKNGINIAGGSAIIRNSQTLRGAPNAAVGVGVNTDASPLAVLGVKDGTTPYVGASQDNASTFADLGILLSGVIKARFTAAGTAFRPESDLTMALGANTLRWTSVYAQNMGITNGATAPTAQTGVARIYIDSAGGAPKIIYPDGTIKTFTVT